MINWIFGSCGFALGVVMAVMCMLIALWLEERRG